MAAKISELTAAGALAVGDVFWLEQTGNVQRKVSIGDLDSRYIADLSGFAELAVDETVTGAWNFTKPILMTGAASDRVVKAQFVNSVAGAPYVSISGKWDDGLGGASIDLVRKGTWARDSEIVFNTTGGSGGVLTERMRITDAGAVVAAVSLSVPYMDFDSTNTNNPGGGNLGQSWDSNYWKMRFGGTATPAGIRITNYDAITVQLSRSGASLFNEGINVTGNVYLTGNLAVPDTAAGALVTDAHYFKAGRHFDATKDYGGYGTTLFLGWDNVKYVLGNSSGIVLADLASYNGLLKGPAIVRGGTFSVIGDIYSSAQIRAEGGGVFTDSGSAAVTGFPGSVAVKSSGNNPYISFHNGGGTRYAYIQMANSTYLQMASESGYLRFLTSAAETMRLTTAGDLLVDGNVVAYSTTISDRNHKEDFRPIKDAEAKLRAITGYHFRWRDTGKWDVGVTAQDVESVLPHAVQTVESMDKGKSKALNPYGLQGLLVQAVNTHSDRLDAMEKRIAVLEAA